jgi:hypothetical protein
MMGWEMPLPNWDTPAGCVLDAFLAGVHEVLPTYVEPVTLFGSAAIQLCLDESFTSADVDVMVMSEGASLRKIAKEKGVGRSGTLRPSYGVQICPPQLFRTTPHYLLRARMEERHGLRVIIPHVRDVLIAKLHRFRTPEQIGLVSKDRRAFERVRELCGGHPSEAEVIEDLVLCAPELNAQPADGLNAFRLNVLALFEEVFLRKLDLEGEVLKPARDAVSEAMSQGEDVGRLLEGLRPERD